jgi:hypothetical protein
MIVKIGSYLGNLVHIEIEIGEIRQYGLRIARFDDPQVSYARRLALSNLRLLRIGNGFKETPRSPQDTSRVGWFSFLVLQVILQAIDNRFAEKGVDRVVVEFEGDKLLGALFLLL